MKLYQNALKLHAEGPAFYAEAEAAYDTLFQSEIFAYPDADVDPQDLDINEADNLAPTADVAGQPAGVGGNVPSTLPQILYLSYKNRGQLWLDYVKQAAQGKPNAPEENLRDVIATHILAKDGRRPLDLFSKALSKDDTDLELWRQTARVGDLHGSKRVARFCLEAVLDENVLKPDISSLCLDKNFAHEKLQDLIRALRDDVSLRHAPSLSLKEKRMLNSSRGI